MRLSAFTLDKSKESVEIYGFSSLLYDMERFEQIKRFCCKKVKNPDQILRKTLSARETIDSICTMITLQISFCFGIYLLERRKCWSGQFPFLHSSHHLDLAWIGGGIRALIKYWQHRKITFEIKFCKVWTEFCSKKFAEQNKLPFLLLAEVQRRWRDFRLDLGLLQHASMKGRRAWS